MDFLQEVLNCDESDIKDLVQERIKEILTESSELNRDIPSLGFVSSEAIDRISSNKKMSDIDNEDYYDDYSIWFGFIPKGKKIVYQMESDENNFFNENGHYYEIDSDEYIYEFINYFKEKQVDIEDPYEMIYHVYYFLLHYFGAFNIKGVSRDTLHTALFDTKGKPITLPNNHSILDFKGIGAAMCTEYSALSCNLLSLFGFTTVFLGGECNGLGHNYTIVTYDEEDECRIVDMSIPVVVYNMAGDFLRYAPFIQTFEEYDNAAFDKFLSGNLDIVVNDYFWIESNNTLYKFEDLDEEEVRNYSVDGGSYENEDEQPPKILII